MKMLPMKFLFVLLLAFLARAWEYRLDNGNLTAGRLMVRRNDEELWGTVCSDGFDNVDATVACRSLGFSGYAGTVVPTSVYGSGVGQILMTNVLCENKFVDSLSQCGFSQTTSSCGHNADVGIVCTVPTVANAAQWSFKLQEDTSQGLVLFRPNNTSPWGAVCRSGGSAAYNAACRSIDPHLYSRYSSSSSRTATAYPFKMTVQECSTNDNVTLVNCFIALETSGSCNGVFLSCRKWDYEARLVNGSNKTSGLLQVRPSDGYPWGTMCNTNFNADDGVNACRFAGVPGMHGRLTTGFAPGQGPIYLSNLRCPSNRTTETSDCNFNSNTTNCTHNSDVRLVCLLPTASKANEWQFSTVGSPRNAYRWLRVRPNASAPWGSVSTHGFTHISASIACQSLGYVYRSASYTSYYLGSSNEVVYMTEVDCDASAANLTQCLFSTQVPSSHASYAVSIYCYSGNNWQYQLSSGSLAASTTTAGILKIMPNSEVGWGTICNDGTFTDAEASNVCSSSLGFQGYVGTVTTRFGAASGPTLVASTNCSGLDAGYHLDDCLYRLPTSRCSQAVGISCHPPSHPVGTWEASFDGSALSAYQIVRLRENSSAPWMPLCYKYFDQNVRAAICSSAGYPLSSYAYYSSIHTSGPYHISNSITCATESPPSLRYCFVGASVRTSSCSVLTIQCGSPSSQFFLSGPHDHRGLLQVASSSNPPGTICSQPSFSGVTPTVACRSVNMAGYSGRVINSGIGSGPIYYSSMSCRANATSLSDCNNQFLPQTCTHANDVGLECSLPTGNIEAKVDDGNRLLLVRLSPIAAWGTVCVGQNGLPNSDAFVRAACGSMGKANYSGWYYTTTASAGYSPAIADVVCADDGKVQNLGQCLYASTNATPCSWYPRVYCNAYWEYKLVGGSDPWSGRVAVRPSDDAPWGTMCTAGDRFDDKAATNICALAGFEGFQGRATTQFGAGTGPIYIANYSCLSMYDEDTCTMNETRGACTSHSLDAGVICTKPTPRQGWEYRLNAFGTSSRSYLLVRPNTSAPWGHVCYDDFTNAAQVACRAVNPNVPTYASYSGSRSGKPGPQYLGPVSCYSSAADSLSDCLAEANPSDTCYNAVTLACYYNPSSWRYQLTSVTSTSSGSIRGLLRVRPTNDAPWGTVCSTGFSATDATVACKSLGYTGTVGTVVSIVGVGGSGPIYMSNVDCATTASSLGYCDFANQTEHQCSHSQDVTIECSPPEHRKAWTYTTDGEDASTTYQYLYARKAGQTNKSYVCYYTSTGSSSFGQDVTRRLACASAGYPYPSYVGISISSMSSGTPFVGLSCGSSDLTTNLNQCEQADTCANRYAVRIYCPPASWYYKLGGTITNTTSVVSGTLMLRPNSADPWGTACSSGFDVKAATIACESVGLRGYVGRVARTVSPGALPVYVHNVNCTRLNDDTRSDRDLGQQCRYDPNGDCTTAVVLECSLPSPTVTAWETRIQHHNSGIMEVRPNASAPWGVFCQSGYSTADANVICNAAGLNYSTGYITSYYYYTSYGPQYASGMRCAAAAGIASIRNCVVDATPPPTSCRYIVGVGCNMQLYGFQYRFRGGTPGATTSGVVETRPNAQVPWGTICHKTYDRDTVPLALCNYLGFTNSFGSFIECPASTATSSSNVPIYATNVECSSSSSCTGFHPTASDECTHAKDLCVSCQPRPSPPASSAQWEVTIKNGGLYVAGAVYVRRNASMAWGHVCETSSYFRKTEATVVCKSIGCTNCVGQYAQQNMGDAYGPAYIADIQCPASATTLGACTVTTIESGSSNCARYAVGVACFPPYKPTVPQDVPASVLRTNRAALVMISDSMSRNDLASAIASFYGITVNVSDTDSTSTNGARAILVEFPSSSDRSLVVAAIADRESEFVDENKFVLAAAELSQNTPGAPTNSPTSGGGGTDGGGSGGSIAGGVVGGIVFVVILVVAGKTIMSRQAQREQHNNKGGGGDGAMLQESFISPVAMQQPVMHSGAVPSQPQPFNGGGGFVHHQHPPPPGGFVNNQYAQPLGAGFGPPMPPPQQYAVQQQPAPTATFVATTSSNVENGNVRSQRSSSVSSDGDDEVLL